VRASSVEMVEEEVRLESGSREASSLWPFEDAFFIKTGTGVDSEGAPEFTQSFSTPSFDAPPTRLPAPPSSETFANDSPLFKASRLRAPKLPVLRRLSLLGRGSCNANPWPSSALTLG